MILNKKIILYFGVLSPRKGQEKAIRAFNKIVKKMIEEKKISLDRAK